MATDEPFDSVLDEAIYLYKVAAPEVCKIAPVTMELLVSKGLGPEHFVPPGMKRRMTTRRMCLAWMRQGTIKPRDYGHYQSLCESMSKQTGAATAEYQTAQELQPTQTEVDESRARLNEEGAFDD
jgi:hypothetical protein